MEKEELIDYLTDQQQTRIMSHLEMFSKAKKECLKDREELLNKYNYRHLSDTENNPVDQAISIFEDFIHSKFIEYCLEPEGYKSGDGEVFASVIGIEKDNDINYVNISLVTPHMAYIDNRYFVSGNDDDDRIWWSDYRPYYYEYTAVLTDQELIRFNNQVNELKTTSEYDDESRWSFWFKAKLKEIVVREPNGYRGILHYGGSPSNSYELVLSSFEPVSTDLNILLNETYHIKISPNASDCVNYLKAFFGNASSYTAEILNVGQANCIYLKNAISNQDLFFDLGRPNDGFYDWKAKKYVKNLDLLPNTDVQNNLAYISTIKPDCIIISHWHLDHFAAYKDLKDYGVKSVWILPKIISKKDIKSANRLLNYLVTNHATVYYLNSTGRIFDNGVVQLLSSASAKDNDPNSRSLILRINNTIFAADCLYEYWPDDLMKNFGDEMRLIVPHHCSKLSSTQTGKNREKFIFDSFNKIQVKEAYISKGFNTYHHPNPYHLAELGKASFNIFFTDNAFYGYTFKV